MNSRIRETLVVLRALRLYHEYRFPRTGICIEAMGEFMLQLAEDSVETLEQVLSENESQAREEIRRELGDDEFENIATIRNATNEKAQLAGETDRQPVTAICDHCKKQPATCIGAYEDDIAIRVACDECCGHGNEDGRCDPIDKPTHSHVSVQVDMRGDCGPLVFDGAEETSDADPATGQTYGDEL